MMESTELENMVYATNSDLTGFFSRKAHEGAYKQERGNGQIRFADVKEFRKFAKAIHEVGFSGPREPDVTSGGRFVWRKIK
jgi:hypothetical protein